MTGLRIDKKGNDMGNTKDDVIFKEFWRSNERFADLFNVVVFGGKEVIKPDALRSSVSATKS